MKENPVCHSSNNSLARRAELVLQPFTQRFQAHAALKELKCLVAFFDREAVDQQRHALFVQQFSAGHIGPFLARIIAIQRKEIEIVELAQRVAIIFGVAVNLQMMTRVEHRPGRRRKAHTADIETVEPSAVPAENARAIYGRRLFPSRGPVDFFGGIALD